MSRSGTKVERCILQNRKAGAAIEKGKRMREIEEYAKKHKVSITQAMIELCKL